MGVATQRTAKTTEAENLICSAGDHGGCCDAALAAMGAATQHVVHGKNSNTSRATTVKAAMQPRDIAMQHRWPWRMLRLTLPEIGAATQGETTTAAMAKVAMQHRMCVCSTVGYGGCCDAVSTATGDGMQGDDGLRR